MKLGHCLLGSQSGVNTGKLNLDQVIFHSTGWVSNELCDLYMYVAVVCMHLNFKILNLLQIILFCVFLITLILLRMVACHFVSVV